MKAVRKVLTLAAMGAIASGSFYGVSALVQNVKFAHAEEQVEASREQLKTTNDFSTVYREVGKAVEPSVVMIKMEKRAPRSSTSGLNPDLLRRFFPDRDGDGQPDLPNNPKTNPNEDGDDNNTDGEADGTVLQEGEGSGVIMEVSGGSGFILTNNHVAGNATKLSVMLSDGREITDVKLVGADPKSDLAVVKITADKLIPAKWGNSDYLAKGDLICAFGSPFGFVGSMTHGIVSALNRDQVHLIAGDFSYENFIQVDAPINPGNSGGPLVNLQGEVVGINTAIASNTGSFNGIGFAIPSNFARPVYEQLKSTGKVTRGWLGVEIANVGEARIRDEVKATGYEDTVGVYVRSVMNNTPATGKLQAGDIITAIDGKPIKNVTLLRNQIALNKPNSDVKFTVFRNEKSQEVVVTLGEQPSDLLTRASRGMRGNRNGGGSNEALTASALGLRVTTPTDQDLKKYGLPDDAKGALVTSVVPGSDAATCGLSAGDLITRIGETSITDGKSAVDALSASKKLSSGVRVSVSNKEGDTIRFLKKSGGKQ